MDTNHTKLGKVRQRNWQPWIEQEDNLLRKLSESNLTAKEITEKHFSYRKINAVKKRLQILKLNLSDFKDWSDTEDQLIKENYFLVKSMEQIVDLLKDRGFDRTYGAIRARATLLGLHKKIVYTKDETFFNQPNVTNSCVAGFIAADGCITYSSQKDQEHR